MRRSAFLLLCLMTAACREAPPSGQVLARVDGLDITRRDLKVELAATGGDADSPNQRGVVDRIIDRAMLAAEARRQGLDRTPSYLADQRRGREVLLVNALRAQIGTGPPPTAVAVDDYIERHPHMFADRTIYVVDRVSAAGAAPALASLREVAPSSAVAARLVASGYRIERDSIVLDTAGLPPAEATALSAMPPDKTVVHVVGGSLVVDSIVGEMRVPVSREQAAREARSALAEKNSRARVDHLLAQLRSTARIERPSGSAP